MDKTLEQINKNRENLLQRIEDIKSGKIPTASKSGKTKRIKGLNVLVVNLNCQYKEYLHGQHKGCGKSIQ